MVADHGLIPAFIEEILRLESAVPASSRVVTEDAVIDGVPIAAGSLVWLCTEAVDRKDNGDMVSVASDGSPQRRHLGFGAGVHRCVGSWLARIGLEAFIGEWLDRIPDFEVEPGFVPRIIHDRGIARPRAVPLRWEPIAVNTGVSAAC